jgi:hypothetical protein
MPAAQLYDRFVSADDALALLMPRSAVAYRRVAARRYPNAAFRLFGSCTSTHCRRI